MRFVKFSGQGKRICHLVDFAIPTDHKVEINERKKIDKYLKLPSEFKKQWIIKVIVIFQL